MDRPPTLPITDHVTIRYNTGMGPSGFYDGVVLFEERLENNVYIDDVYIDDLITYLLYYKAHKEQTLRERDG